MVDVPFVMLLFGGVSTGGTTWAKGDNGQGGIASTAFEDVFFCWKLLGETDFLKYDV